MRLSGEQSVGYQIRLETKGGKNTPLMFYTNGIMLRKLTSSRHNKAAADKPSLREFTHIVVDEVHERDKFADFLLIRLRDLLQEHPTLRLILMSATLNQQMYSDYFGGCPVIEVPGFTHPVQSFFLEDVLQSVGYQPQAAASKGGQGMQAVPIQRHDPLVDQFGDPRDPQVVAELERLIEEAFMSGSVDGGNTSCGSGHPALLLMQLLEGHGISYVDYQHSVTGATALMVMAALGRLSEVQKLLVIGADPTQCSNDGARALEWSTRFGHDAVHAFLLEKTSAAASADAEQYASLLMSSYQLAANPDEIDVDLIHNLMAFLQQAFDGMSEDANAVLVFLPGWEEITRVRDALEDSLVLNTESCSLWVCVLHSMVAQAEQRKAFRRPPAGQRKVVLATNVAETAITIDDVVCVIDSGRVKEKSYDPYTNVCTLQGTWISKASEKQREGRAGRCRPGICYHLYSRRKSEALPAFQLPELKRTPLEELCLQVRLIDPAAATTIEGFLSRAMEAPVANAVANAVHVLQDIGALDQDERLTTLGTHLAALPLHPRVGKMLLFGILFRCLDPILTIAAGSSYRSPFVLPSQPKDRAVAKEANAAASERFGGFSDQFALLSHYMGWQAAKRAGSGAERAYCARNFLSGPTLHMMRGLKDQFHKELQIRGLVPGDGRSYEVNSRNYGLVRAVLAMGFYPMVGRLMPRQQAVGGNRDPQTLITRNFEKARIHPQSCVPKLGNGKSAENECILCLYEELTRIETTLYVRDVTLVDPHPLILASASLRIVDEVRPQSGTEEQPGTMTTTEEHDDTTVLVMDEWLRFKVSTPVAAGLQLLRVRMQEAFSHRIHCTEKGERSTYQLPQRLEGAIRCAEKVFDVESSILVPRTDAATYDDHDRRRSCPRPHGEDQYAGIYRGRGGKRGRGSRARPTGSHQVRSPHPNMNSRNPQVNAEGGERRASGSSLKGRGGFSGHYRG
eukprot:scaffold1456_cov392-Prasinococcus_capsulatus_cf.AAC.11